MLVSRNTEQHVRRTETTPPHSNQRCVLLFGGLEYTWVATDGLIAYSRLEEEEVPSFMSPEWKNAVNEANKLIKKSTKIKLKHFIKMVNKQNQRFEYSKE